MKRLCLILTLCGLCGIPAAVFAQEATTGSVRGHVTDASTTQLPAQGVRVVIVSVNGLENEAETDSNGEYQIVGLAPGRYLISFSKKGYWGYENKPVTVIAGGDHYVPLKTAENATTGRVRGNVADTSEVQRPIGGVRVVIVSANGLENEAGTDSSGEYQIVGLAPGRYLMSFSKKGYWGYENKPVTVIAGGDHYVPLKMAENATTGTVRGNILDTSEAQLPIEGVQVVIVRVDGLENEVKTDSNGDFEIIGLAPGRYLLSIYKVGYGDRTGKPVTVVAGGDHYVPLKMTKRAGLINLLERQLNSAVWPFLLCVGGAFALGYLIGRAGRRSD